jgi:5-methylthioadenosine/S-adenosylhomocysteine deaminase
MEMDTAAKLHKVNLLDPTVMDARTVLKMATLDAARALGIGHETGSLEVGKKADIVIVDTNKPHLTPLYDVFSHLVYSASGSDVDTVLINGRIVVENARLLTMDINAVMSDMRMIAAEIRKIDTWLNN